MNYPIKIPSLAYDLMRSLLQRGVMEYDGKRVDFSEVQDIKIQQGVMTFTPPAKVNIAVGPFNIKTTMSSITARTDGVEVEIDYSPVNIKVTPQ
jgi:hypothetical protein